LVDRSLQKRRRKTVSSDEEEIRERGDSHSCLSPGRVLNSVGTEPIRKLMAKFLKKKKKIRVILGSRRELECGTNILVRLRMLPSSLGRDPESLLFSNCLFDGRKRNEAATPKHQSFWTHNSDREAIWPISDGRDALKKFEVHTLQKRSR